jgi:ribosomal protein S18 acetylase RimI-like enzyme
MPTQTVTIREATAGDAEALAVVYLDSAEHHQRLDPSMYSLPDFSQMVARYRRRLPAPGGSTILVAEVEGEVVGWVEVQIREPDGEPRMNRDSTSAEVDIGVLADMRDRGIGTRLMTAAEAWAFERGAEFMFLQTHVANGDAIRFYQERHGWRTTGLVLMKRPGKPAV